MALHLPNSSNYGEPITYYRATSASASQLTASDCSETTPANPPAPPNPPSPPNYPPCQSRGCKRWREGQVENHRASQVRGYFERTQRLSWNDTDPSVRMFAGLGASRIYGAGSGFWPKRERWFVGHIPPGAVVLDLGAGAMHLRTALQGERAPAHYVRRSRIERGTFTVPSLIPALPALAACPTFDPLRPRYQSTGWQGLTQTRASAPSTAGNCRSRSHPRQPCW